LRCKVVNSSTKSSKASIPGGRIGVEALKEASEALEAALEALAETLEVMEVLKAMEPQEVAEVLVVNSLLEVLQVLEALEALNKLAEIGVASTITISPVAMTVDMAPPELTAPSINLQVATATISRSLVMISAVGVRGLLSPKNAINS